MANIILSTPAQQRQGVVDNRVSRVEDQAAYQAAKGLAALSEAVGKITQREQELKAASDAAEMQAELSVWLKEQEASGNVDNLAARLKQEKDKRLDRLREKNKSLYYKDAMNERGVAVYAGLIGQAENTEINGRFSQQQADLDRMIAANNTFVMNNPALWKEKADETEAAINAAVLPAETKAKMVKQARHDFAVGALNEAFKINPDIASGAVRTKEFERELSIAERQKYISSAITAKGSVKTDAAVYADLSERAQNGENMMADARSAMIRGEITVDNYNGLRSLYEKERGSDRSYLMRNLKSEGWFKTPDLEMAELDAQREAEAWIRQQKNVTLFDMDNKITELRYKYSLFQNQANVALPEKKRKETVKLYYNSADGSSYKAPTYNGLRQTAQSVFLRKDLTEDAKKQILQALDVELNILQNKGQGK